jgi:nucleoside-diphosphate-sugar epimerase
MSNMKKKVLLTGVTGNLGAYAAREFLKKEYKVYVLARLTSNSDSSKRVLKSILTFGADSEIIDSIKSKNLVIIPVDISIEDDMSKIKLPEEIDETWHFASTLKYLPKDIEEIYSTNVKGTKNVILLHKKSSHENSKFFYISTSYVGGKDISVIPESRIEINEDMAFHNEYEHSKLKAENIVLDQISLGIINGNIFRPSVVVGDKNNGLLINYHGFYLSINTLYNFKESLRKNNEKLGVLNFESNPDATVNLIPIEDAVALMNSIVETNPPNGEVYNIVNEKEIRIGNILSVIGDELEIKLRACEKDNKASINRTKKWYDKLMDYGGNYFMPYLNHQITYDNSASFRQLKSRYEYDLEPRLNNLARIYVDILKEESREN